MQNLEYEKFPEQNHEPESIVILMHGIGADAFDLLPLAKHWSLVLKKTKFYSIHAPFQYTLAPFGKQWFDLQDRDQTRILKEIDLVKPILISFLKKKLKQNNLNFKDLILVGFSQGTMVALNLALTMEEKIKGVLGYSGGIILSKSGKIKISSKPKICLIHGNDDEIVPKKMMEKSKTILEEKNILTETHLIQELGHGINDKALNIGEKFLVKYLLKC